MNTEETVNSILLSINNIILGKEKEIRLVLTCLLAKGHLLIEDIPGVGKTTLAQSIAKTLGLNFNRIQCTSDLLPALGDNPIYLSGLFLLEVIIF